MFEFGEVFNLAFDVVIFLFLAAYFVYHPKSRRFFLLPMTSLLLSHCFTVLEGFFMPTLLDLLEHLFFLASAVFLAIGLTRLLREDR